MLHFVKLRVERDGIGKIYADIFVNLPGERVALVHQLLHRFQLLRGRKSRFEFVAARFRQLDYRVLREILAAYAEIAAPFVLHGVFVEVHGHERQFRKPAVDAAVLIDIAHGFAGAHGNAEDLGIVQIDGAGKRGNVAVVRDFDGRAHLFCYVYVHILHVIAVLLFIHLDKQRSHHDFVIHVHARRRYADAVYARHFGSRRFHRR